MRAAGPASRLGGVSLERNEPESSAAPSGELGWPPHLNIAAAVPGFPALSPCPLPSLCLHPSFPLSASPGPFVQAIPASPLQQRAVRVSLPHAYLPIPVAPLVPVRPFLPFVPSNACLFGEAGRESLRSRDKWVS